MGSERIERKKERWFLQVWDWRGKTLAMEIIALGILIVSSLAFVWNRTLFKNTTIESDVWGQYGDFIGGIIGTLIAYISVRLLIKTLNVQIKANIDTANINHKTSEVYELQQFNEMFNTLFALYKNAKESYRDEDEKCKHENLLALVDKVRNASRTELIKKQDYEESNKVAIRIYESFYAKNHDAASVHFRLLYRIFKLINSAAISDSNRTTISKTVRCQLTEEELFLLRYNAMSKCGEKMQHHINQYNLLKHLPLLNILEFSNFCVILDKDDINCMNVELQILSKNIKKLFLKTSEEKKNISERLSKDDKYTLKVSISADNKDFNIELIKSNKGKISKKITTNTERALDKLDNDEIKGLLLSYCKELFVYSNFQLFNKLEELSIIPEITNQKESKKVIISVNINNKKGYQLICSKKQLDNPQ